MARDEGDPRRKNPNPEGVMGRHVPFEVVVAEYPHLEEYLKEHRKAQIQGDKRLMSAEEKIERFGGIDQVRRNLQGTDPEGVVLQACRDGIMVEVEIFRFAKAIGYFLDPFTIHYILVKLQDPGESEHGQIKQIPGITLIRYYERLLFSTQRGWMIAERRGYLTTDEGIRQLARDPIRENAQGLFGRLIRPQGI